MIILFSHLKLDVQVYMRIIWLFDLKHIYHLTIE